MNKNRWQLIDLAGLQFYDMKINIFRDKDVNPIGLFHIIKIERRLKEELLRSFYMGVNYNTIYELLYNNNDGYMYIFASGNTRIYNATRNTDIIYIDKFKEFKEYMFPIDINLFVTKLIHDLDSDKPSKEIEYRRYFGCFYNNTRYDRDDISTAEYILKPCIVDKKDYEYKIYIDGKYYPGVYIIIDQDGNIKSSAITKINVYEDETHVYFTVYNNETDSSIQYKAWIKRGNVDFSKDIITIPLNIKLEVRSLKTYKIDKVMRLEKVKDIE